MASKSKNLAILLSPSTSSAVIIVILSLVFVVWNFINALDPQSLTREILQSNYRYSTPFFTAVTDFLSRYFLFSNLLLILFWSVVGAAIYEVAEYIYKLVSNTVEAEKSLSYVNINRTNFLENLLASFTLRTVSLLLWLMYCAIFFKVILPYAKYVVQAMVNSPLISQIFPLLQIFVVIGLAMHVHVVLFRLIALKLRLF